MSIIDCKLVALKEEAWQVAGLCREEGDSEALFRVLVDFSERITNLLRGRVEPGVSKKVGSSELIDIFSPDGRHNAKLQVNRWLGKGSKCVLMNGEWVSLSKAAVSITGYPTRGPEWWKYSKNGERKPVSELKQQ